MLRNINYNVPISSDKGSFEKMLSKCNSLVIVSQIKSTSPNELKCSNGSFPNCLQLVNDSNPCFNNDWNTTFECKIVNKMKNDLLNSSRDPLNEVKNDAIKEKQRQLEISDMLHPYHSESLEKLKNINEKMKLARQLRNSQANWNLKRLVGKSNSQETIMTFEDIKFDKNKIRSLARSCKGQGMKRRAMSRMPDILYCYICGHQYGRSSLPFHERQCLKKWHIVNNRRPPLYRRAPPKKLRGSNSGDLTIKEQQDLHWHMYLENRPKCKFCKKRFSPFKVDSHEAICKKIKKPYCDLARKIQLEKLQNRIEISHRFSLSRSPLLSLITRLKVIAQEEVHPKIINFTPINKRLIKHKSEPAKLRAIPSKPRSKHKVQCLPKPKSAFVDRSRSSPKIILPEITVEEDLITKIENWQMRSLWENSEEVQKLKRDS